VTALRRVPGGLHLSVEAGSVADGVKPGDSVAVDGACLTVAEIRGTQLDFDVISETVSRSTLSERRIRDSVNLERSLRVGDRLDGHFVQGHVDCVAAVTRREVSAREWAVWLRPDNESLKYVVPKGSVAINGVSLTVAKVQGDEFCVALVPTTLARTSLPDLQTGDRVNVETDILTRTIVHTLEAGNGGGGLTLDHLREHGYL